MTRIKKLFKLQLDNKFNIFKQKDVKGFIRLLLKNIIIISAITLALYLILNKLILILSIHINEQLLAIVLLATQLIAFCFATANIISTLYLSKDNELLMVLPVTFNQLFVSKILILYVTDLIHSLMYMLPILTTLGILGNLGIGYYVMMCLLIPILPILPISFASLVSIPIIFILKFFKRHITLSILTLLIMVASVFVVYMNIVGKISGAFNLMEKQMETSILINAKIFSIGAGVWGYLQLAESLLSFKYIYYPLLFLIVSFVIMCVCFLLIKPFYYKVSTINMENTSVVKNKYKKFKKRKPFGELLLNETRAVLRSPGYIFQFFLFPLFMPLIVFTYDKLLISIAVNQAGQNMIFGSHILVLCIIALMSNTISSIAISKEGGTFYIAKTTPINFYVQVTAKVVFNLIFTVSAILITTILSLIATSLQWWVVVLSGIIAIILSVGHICQSFDFDLQNPVLDWYDNSEISTIGKNTTKSIIYALVLSALMCILVTLLGTLGIYMCLIFSVVYALGRIHLLYVRTKYYYNKMEI